MSSELSADGKGALLNTDTRNTLSDRIRARRTCAVYALAGPAPHQTLAELLDQLGLRPASNEPR